MDLTEEGLNQIEHHADKQKNVNMMFQVQILRELRELKALLNQPQDSCDGSNDSTDCANKREY